jgi:hypothetical protein
VGGSGRSFILSFPLFMKFGKVMPSFQGKWVLTLNRDGVIWSSSNIQSLPPPPPINIFSPNPSTGFLNEVCGRTNEPLDTSPFCFYFTCSVRGISTNEVLF